MHQTIILLPASPAEGALSAGADRSVRSEEKGKEFLR